MAENECVTCKKLESQAVLHKCPICFRYYCDEHFYQMGGRRFCTQQCAEYFFFDDSEE